MASSPESNPGHIGAKVKFLKKLQPRSQGLSSLPPLVVRTGTLVAAGHVTIYPSKTAGWVGTQLHLVERTIKYHRGEAKLFWCLVLKHDFSAKTIESSDIPLSPCLSKFVTVTIKNLVAPPFQQIFLPPRFWVVTWPAATRVSVPTT